MARFLKAYQHPRLSRPAERLCLPLSRVHDRLSESKLGGLPGARRQLLLFETGLRLYRKAHPELKPVLVEVKALEDTSGWALDATRAADLGRQNGAPVEVQKVLDQRAASLGRKLSSVIQARWTPASDGRIPAVEDALKVLAATPFAVEEEDTAYVRKRFRSKLKKLSKETYDLTILEGKNGVHELRRDLRWVRYFAVSTDGVIQFSADDSPTSVGLRTYAWLPRPDLDTDHIFVSAKTYKSALVASNELASVKESWELIEAFESAFRESGVETRPEAARREALKLLGLSETEPTRLIDEAKRIYAGIVNDEVSLSLRREVKARPKHSKVRPVVPRNVQGE